MKHFSVDIQAPYGQMDDVVKAIEATEYYHFLEMDIRKPTVSITARFKLPDMPLAIQCALQVKTITGLSALLSKYVNQEEVK